MHSLSIQFQNISLWILPVIITVLIVIYLSYRRRSSEPKWPLSVLIVLRSVIFFLILLLILKPVVSWETRRIRKPLVLLFADRSLSMVAHDGISADSIRSAVFNLKTLMEKRGARVKVLPFGLQVGEEIDRPDELIIDVDGTDIAGAIDYCVNNQDDRDINAAVLVSDGVSTSGEDPLLLKTYPRLPVYTVGVGDSLLIMDPAVIELTMPSKAGIGDSVVIEARVLPLGHGNATTVWLEKDGRIVGKRTIPTSRNALAQTIHFTTIPDQAGIARYSVLIDTVRDRNPYNNSRKALLRVFDTKKRLVIIQGRKNFESRFFDLIVRSMPEFEIVDLFNYQGKWHTDNETDPFQLKWDVVALFSFPAEDVTMSQLNSVSSKIARDKPALYIQYLPAVTPDRLNRILPEPVILKHRLMKSEIPSVISRVNEEHRNHPVLMNLITERHFKSDWADLPPIGMPFLELRLPNDFIPVIVSDERNSLPILSLREAGGGRSVFVSGIDLWRWNMMTAEADNRYIYPELMTSVLKWLTDTLSTSNMQFSLNKEIYLKGEIAEVTGIITDIKGAVIPDATLDAELIDAGNNSVNFLIQWDGTKYRGYIPLKREGDYQIHISSATRDFSLGEFRKKIQVLPNSVEHQNIRQDVTMLQGIANRTGGAYFTLDNYRNIVDKISFEFEEFNSFHKVKLWRRPGIFIILLLAMVTEWVIRRTSGYQ